MPEGHTLHRLARLHRRRYAGLPVGVSSPQGRFATAAEVADGRVLTGTDAPPTSPTCAARPPAS